MKSCWAIKKLGEVCELIGGGTPSIHESSYYGGNIPWATVRDMNCRVIEKTERTITRKGLENSASNVIPAGNVIISTHVGLGKVCFVAQDTAINQDLKGVIPFADNIQKTFLYYWFLSIADYLEKSGTGSTVRGVKLDFVKSIELPVPPLPEQNRIVAKIDAAFEKIDKLKVNAERNLANAKELFQSALDEAMRPKKGWVEKRLGEVCTEFGRGKSKHRPRNDKRLYGGPYPFIQTGDIRNAGHTIDKFTKTYSEFGLSQSKRWPKGTLCITIAANIAETAILGFDACFPDSVIGCVFDESQMHTGFAEYMLQNYKCHLQTLGKDRSSAQPNINLGTFEDNSFSVPAVDKQRQIVKWLDALAEKTKLLEQHYTRQIADCAEMRQSVLREAFEGRM